MSWCTTWYHHLSCPVLAFSATNDEVKRFWPGPRLDQGAALPVVNTIVFWAGSTDGVFQTVAPPVATPSGPAAHVWPPMSPGCGTVKNRHRKLPLVALYALMLPRKPNSPPVEPTYTTPL